MRASPEKTDRRRSGNKAADRRSLHDRLPIYDKGLVSRITSFFVYNFREDSTNEDIFYVFRRELLGIGCDVGSYIARKDRRGNKYAFVRIADITSVKAVTEKMNEVWMGRKQLSCSLAQDQTRMPPKSAD